MINIRRYSSFDDLQEFPSIPTPFQTHWYYSAYVKHFCDIDNVFILGLYDNESYIGYGCFEKIGKKAVFLGMKPILDGQEVTDYGDITVRESYKNTYPEIWAAILRWMADNSVAQIQLDYIRADSETYAIFKDKASQQTVSPYLQLPGSWEDYLVSLDRTDRKELKRKTRRLESVSSDFTQINDYSPDGFAEFVRLHRLSDKAKSNFMSERMAAYFMELLSVHKKQWETEICFLTIGGKNSAALLTMENTTQVLAYNSGHDPLQNYYSSGLLLHAFKIRQAIGKGKKTYDFLRGEERYKYDLGAKNLQLYRIILFS